MIIVCPNCSTRYMIPDGSIGESGRKVRCNNCKELWTQDADAVHQDVDFYDPDDTADEGDDYTLPAEGDTSFLDEVRNAGEQERESLRDDISIPESIYPDKNDKSLDAIKAGFKKAKHWKNYVSGVVCGAFILIFGVVIICANARGIIIAHNGLRPVFAALNSDPFGYVKDVIFDNVSISYQKDTNSFVMDGLVINLQARDVLLPAVKITFSDEHYVTLDVWHAIISDEKILQGEQSIGLSLEYPMDAALAKDVRSVVIEFVEGDDVIAHDVDIKPASVAPDHDAVHTDATHDAPVHNMPTASDEHPPQDDHSDHH
jgi:predicted Zn finger-like uncharacterized protein